MDFSWLVSEGNFQARGMYATSQLINYPLPEKKISGIFQTSYFIYGPITEFRQYLFRPSSQAQRYFNAVTGSGF